MCQSQWSTLAPCYKPGTPGKPHGTALSCDCYLKCHTIGIFEWYMIHLNSASFSITLWSARHPSPGAMRPCPISPPFAFAKSVIWPLLHFPSPYSHHDLIAVNYFFSPSIPLYFSFHHGLPLFKLCKSKMPAASSERLTGSRPHPFHMRHMKKKVYDHHP